MMKTMKHLNTFEHFIFEQQTNILPLIIDEKSSDPLKLSDQVKEKKNISIDESTIEVNLDKPPFTFRCNKGNTQVYLLKLVWNIPQDKGKIPSATAVIEANKVAYPKTRILKQGKFENDTRDWAVVGLIK